MMSELFSGKKKGRFMAKSNKVVYRDVVRLFLGFLFVALIFCRGSSVCAGVDGGKASNKIDLVRWYVSDGLLLYNELKSESGRDFVRARKMHAGLLGIYLREMKSRQRDYAAELLTEEAASIASILKELGYIREGLKEAVPVGEENPNDWAMKDVNDASERVGRLLIGFEPYLKTAFDIDGFEKLGDECREELRKALEGVTAKLKVYIKGLTTKKANDLMIKRAAEVCEANRKAIVLLFLARFARFEDPEVNGETSGEGLDLRTLRQFGGDINRTIYWNRVLQKRLEGDDASLLKKYSASEFRRLRVLRSVEDEDMREAQDLLLKTLVKSHPLKTGSDESR